uniref:Uncharacterized protein n=1 Tax=Eubacterium cellulosolvens (strain ATCC 43171 / JCM 9499 / 6) TaxID=633697 RepID=I5AVF5_EUBC6
MKVLSGSFFYLIGNSSEFPMRQNAPRDAQLADGNIASRFCSRAKALRRSPSGMRGWGSRGPLADFVVV